MRGFQDTPATTPQSSREAESNYNNAGSYALRSPNAPLVQVAVARRTEFCQSKLGAESQKKLDQGKLLVGVAKSCRQSYRNVCKWSVVAACCGLTHTAFCIWGGTSPIRPDIFVCMHCTADFTSLRGALKHSMTSWLKRSAFANAHASSCATLVRQTHNWATWKRPRANWMVPWYVHMLVVRGNLLLDGRSATLTCI